MADKQFYLEFLTLKVIKHQPVPSDLQKVQYFLYYHSEMLSPVATSRKVEEKSKTCMEENEVEREGNRAKVLITLIM